MDDKKYIRMAFEVAARARRNGNHPFGALLVDENGTVLMQAENTVSTGKDCTGHAETNLMRNASHQFPPEVLARCTMYTSTEPCPMCAGATFWAGVRRVVFGCSMERLYAMSGESDIQSVLYLGCRAIFEKGKEPTEVLGPFLEDEAVKVHEGFWV